jgi:hypothetical protein
LVADADQLGDAMGNDDHGGAAVAQLAHLAEQPLGRVQVESRRRLVQDQNLGLAQQGAPDGDPLLDAERQAADRHLGIDVEAGQLLHQGVGGAHLLPDRERLGEEAVEADEEIIGDGALVRDQHLLKHRGDAGPAGLEWRARHVPQHRYLAAIRGQHPRHYLGQRALTATVTADDGVDLALPGAEGAAVQRLGDAEDLVHIHDRDGCRRGRRCRRRIAGDTVHGISSH